MKTKWSFMLPVFFLTLSMSFLIGGCGGNQTEENRTQNVEKNMLSQKEMDEIIFHATNFVSESKKARLSDEERELIKTTRPTLKVNYTGYKRGIMRIEWVFTSPRQAFGSDKQEFVHRTVRLSTPDGDLLRQRTNWMLQIFTNYSDQAVKDDFLKINDDEIALPR